MRKSLKLEARGILIKELVFEQRLSEVRGFSLTEEWTGDRNCDRWKLKETMIDQNAATEKHFKYN